MKTAMQQLIEAISSKYNFKKFEEYFKEEIEQGLEKEKEQIIEAYGRAICMFYESEQPEEYYNETFNQNI
jgi:hypothetical protein